MKALVASRKGLFVLNEEEKNWSTESFHFEGVKVSLAEHNPHDGSLWAGVNHGHWGPKLHLSTDGGKTFKETSVPKFPEGGKDKLEDFWAFSFDQSGRVYVGTQPAAIFYSDDKGESWNIIESLYKDPQKENWFGGGADETCLHSILVHPNNQDHITVGISCAGVLESKDRGVSWNYRSKGLKAYFLPDHDSEVGQDPHLVVRAKSNPDLLWQQNHCGLFRSKNGGEVWEDCSEKKGVVSPFGWSICVDDEDPNIVFSLPAKSDEIRVPVDHRLYVMKSTDGGESWEGKTEGLPSGDCFDISYRHAFDMHGKKLAFATTTGNLYASYDHGESWKQEYAHLPPIYSLRLF